MAWIFAVFSLCALGYSALALWSARAFRRSAAPSAGEFAPAVSILKPLKGLDPDAYKNLRSHCVQEYPEYELLFGVNDASDPAAELVRRLMAEFPQRPIRLLVCTNVLGANRKVSNLAEMAQQASFTHLVVNDGDIAVPPDYLRRVMAPFANERTGVVTCVYRGVAGKTLGSKLEALGISTDFIPGVLTARQLEGVRFALGSTMAVRREALAAIGGFEALVDYLADDYELGARVASAGYDVVLSDSVVESHLPDYRFGEFIAHQLRWGRTVRDSRPWGYRLMFLTFALPWAVLTVVAARGAPWSWGLLAAALIMRYAVAYAVGARLLGDPLIARAWWLLPLRDLLAPVLWFASLFGRNITWRGERFIITDRKLQRVEPSRS